MISKNTKLNNKDKSLDLFSNIKLKKKFLNKNLQNINLNENIFSFKEEDNKNEENIRTNIIRYNKNYRKKSTIKKEKLNKIILSEDETRKLTKGKNLSNPLLIKKEKIHKKDFALAERLFLSSRFAFSNNLNNENNQITIDNNIPNLFKLSKKNKNIHFSTEKKTNIK
jgi:hypothetical protein